MGLRTRNPISVLMPAWPAGEPVWPTEVAQLLEEHHLVAWSHAEAERSMFAQVLERSLRAMPDTQVCVIRGEKIDDLGSLVGELVRGLGATAKAESTIDGANGLLAILRRRPPEADGAPIKRRYYIWVGADVLLRKDPALFGRAVDAMTGVAAEAEYASEDLLLIHRAVFVGGPALDVYAEDPRGQFRTWLREVQVGEGDEDRALWEVVSGLKRPPVLPYHIGALD